MRSRSVAVVITTPANVAASTITTLETSIGSEIDSKMKSPLFSTTGSVPLTQAQVTAMNGIGCHVAGVYVGLSTAPMTGTHRALMRCAGLPFIGRVELGAPE